MSKSIRFFIFVALAAPLSTMSAQSRSTVSGTELQAAASKTPGVSKEGLKAFLATDQVKKIAGQAGINVSELSGKVGNLDQASLQQLGQQTKLNDDMLIGGRDVYVISAGTVIIVLLLILILTR